MGEYEPDRRPEPPQPSDAFREAVLAAQAKINTAPVISFDPALTLEVAQLGIDLRAAEIMLEINPYSAFAALQKLARRLSDLLSRGVDYVLDQLPEVVERMKSLANGIALLTHAIDFYIEVSATSFTIGFNYSITNDGVG